MSATKTFDITPEQYHSGVAQLWAAMPERQGAMEDDVLVIAAKRIRELKNLVTRFREHNKQLSEWSCGRCTVGDGSPENGVCQACVVRWPVMES